MNDNKQSSVVFLFFFAKNVSFRFEFSKTGEKEVCDFCVDFAPLLLLAREKRVLERERARNNSFRETGAPLFDGFSTASLQSSRILLVMWF